MGSKAARKGEQQVAQSQQNLAGQYTTDQQNALKQYNAALAAIENPQSSPLYASDYAQGIENVGNTYGQLRQQAYKMLGATGFGNAPSGQRSSMLNTIGNEQANAETQAYRDALNRAEQQGVTEAGLSQNQERIYDPNAPLSGASTSWQRRAGMGSTLGDIATGLTDAAGIAAAPFTGGASLSLLAAQPMAAMARGGAGGASGEYNYSPSTLADMNSVYGGSPSTGFASLPTSTSSIAPSVSSSTNPLANINTSGLASLFAQPRPTGNYRPASSTKSSGAGA